MRDERRVLSVPRVPPLFSRRSFLRAALAGASTAAGAAVLAACGTTSSLPPTSSPAPTVFPTIASAPTTVPSPTATVAAMSPAPAATTAPPTAAPGGGAMIAATPTATNGKIPSRLPSVPDAYLTPPAPFKSVAVIPGKGSKIAIFKASQQPPPPPKSENAWWQELEKRLGLGVDFTLVPLPSYTEKATTLIAGGDLPDLISISPQSTPDQYKAVQQGVFADLTPFLAGDALKQFPNLAQYPAWAWKNAAIGGKAYGVPRLGFLFGNPLLYRQDWAEKLGVPAPKNADEVFRLFDGMTKGDPDSNGKPDTFALGAQGGDWSFAFVQGMFRVPNTWRKNADGTLTHALETDEYRQALTFAKRLYDAGVYHPDAATMNRSQATQALIAGKIGGYVDQLIQLNGDIRTRYEAKRVTPTANLGALVPPGADGGKGVTYNGLGFGGLIAMPARAAKDPERARELLRVLDYYAAPFGSEEYDFLNFGSAGTHHTVQPDGTRVLNDRGRTEINEMGNVVYAPRVLYFPADPGDAAYLQTAATDIATVGIDNPALTAFSPTNATKGGELNRFTADRLTALITGRDPLTALDAFVKDWRARGGDTIRKEYEDALKSAP